MTLWESTNDTPLLAFDVTTTLVDQMAFNRYFRTLPAVRGRRMRNIVLALAAAPLVALLVCVVALWAVAGTGCDLDEALGSSGRGIFFAKVLGAVLFVEAGAIGGIYAFGQRGIEASVRALLLKRPHIDPSDPELRETTSLSMHAHGFRSSNASAGYAYAWALAERFDETADHMFLMVEPAFGFIMPKRELAPDTVLSLREIARQVVKKAGAAGEA